MQISVSPPSNSGFVDCPGVIHGDHRIFDRVSIRESAPRQDSKWLSSGEFSLSQLHCRRMVFREDFDFSSRFSESGSRHVLVAIQSKSKGSLCCTVRMSPTQMTQSQWQHLVASLGLSRVRIVRNAKLFGMDIIDH